MDANATPPRPERGEVAPAYDLGVDAYVKVWSAIIRPPAEAVVAGLGLERSARVIDVGGGSGALAPAIRRQAPAGAVIAIDASIEMLRANRDSTGAPVVHGDALALPVRDASADGVLLAYVLFHLRDPVGALAEAGRVLRPGAAVGSVTWKSEAPLPAFTVWDTTLTESGAPPLASRRVDAGLDSPEAMVATLAAAGLEPVRTWIEPLQHQWTFENYWRMATGSGMNQLRLQQLDDRARAETLARGRDRLSSVPPADYAWSGEVVCSIARRPT